MNPPGACLKPVQEVIHLLQRYPAVEPPSLLLIKRQAQVEGLMSPIGGGSVQIHTFSSASLRYRNDGGKLVEGTIPVVCAEWITRVEAEVVA